jgi:hypothetical protein
MKNDLRLLTNELLWTSVHSARRREREVLKELLEVLLEVDRRGLHLKKGYASLWAFLTEGLGYEPASAHRRLQALRAVKAVPEIKEQVASGVLTLSAVATGQGYVQALTQKRPVSTAEKRELFTALQSMTKLQAEKFVLKKASQENPSIKGLSERPDQVRAVAPERTELRFAVGPAFEKKLARLRELYFHQNPNASLEELLEWAMGTALKTLDPGERQARRVAKKEAEPGSDSAAEVDPHSTALPAADISRSSASEPRPTQAQKDLALATAQQRCQHIDPQARRRCTETRGLELDHRFPRSWGGENSAANFQILCRAHNQWKGAVPPARPYPSSSLEKSPIELLGINKRLNSLS